MSAVLFGSISTLADTSELQRESFNRAFAEHDLGWTWDRDDYLATLTSNGGANRIADYARSVGATVDAAAVHETKTRIFQESLSTASVAPRPGVVGTIRGAKDAGLKLGLVTTTVPGNVTALLTALAPDVRAEDFDVIVDLSDVDASKPDPAAYAFALARLEQDPADCVAVEDNVGGAQSAAAAGVACVAFPNANTAGHEFPTAQQRVEELDLAQLRSLVAS